mmetsp:Transcript_18580/g.70529  ORF Transcript_18580/g.70529 Transcript_18580/m.70529 type:complete len:397 (+) Transcript_18580:1408-2598(+)
MTGLAHVRDSCETGEVASGVCVCFRVRAMRFVGGCGERTRLNAKPLSRRLRVDSRHQAVTQLAGLSRGAHHESKPSTAASTSQLLLRRAFRAAASDLPVMSTSCATLRSASAGSMGTSSVELPCPARGLLCVWIGGRVLRGKFWAALRRGVPERPPGRLARLPWGVEGPTAAGADALLLAALATGSLLPSTRPRRARTPASALRRRTACLAACKLSSNWARALASSAAKEAPSSGVSKRTVGALPTTRFPLACSRSTKRDMSLVARRDDVSWLVMSELVMSPGCATAQRQPAAVGSRPRQSPVRKANRALRRRVASSVRTPMHHCMPVRAWCHTESATGPTVRLNTGRPPACPEGDATNTPCTSWNPSEGTRTSKAHASRRSGRRTWPGRRGGQAA